MHGIRSYSLFCNTPQGPVNYFLINVCFYHFTFSFSLSHLQKELITRAPLHPAQFQEKICHSKVLFCIVFYQYTALFFITFLREVFMSTGNILYLYTLYSEEKELILHNCHTINYKKKIPALCIFQIMPVNIYILFKLKVQFIYKLYIQLEK